MQVLKAVRDICSLKFDISSVISLTKSSYQSRTLRGVTKYNNMPKEYQFELFLLTFYLMGSDFFSLTHIMCTVHEGKDRAGRGSFAKMISFSYFTKIAFRV